MIHDDLLELADHLTHREAGRPRQASLRRAISTAYYAVFHALAYLCASTLVGWSKSWEAVAPVYRSLDHGTAKRLFERAQTRTIFGEDVAAIGNIFISLQQARHAADYDPQPLARSHGETVEIIGRRETEELIKRARQAIQLIQGLPADTRLLLAVHLIARQR